jgi:hypothetical protein
VEGTSRDAKSGGGEGGGYQPVHLFGVSSASSSLLVLLLSPSPSSKMAGRGRFWLGTT